MVLTGDAEELAISIETMLRSTPPLPSAPCIYRVPDVLRRVNEEAYTPRILSIGPLHKETSEAMQVHKQRYLHDFLGRNTNKNLRDYVATLRGIEETARNCYAESTDVGSPDEFVKTMLLDGCFVVELFLKYKRSKFRNPQDPIFKTPLILNEISSDLLLIENQIPLFVLERLFNEMNVQAQGSSLTTLSFLDLTKYFFDHDLKLGQDLSSTINSTQVKHFVDLLLHSYRPTEARVASANDGAVFFIPSATELHEAGVTFASCEGQCFLDVNFSNGVLEIPAFVVTDITESRLRNLIAMEQCHGDSTRYISDYVILMDCLIDTCNDVALLRNCKIIDNLLGDDEELSQLFNKISSGVTMSPKDFYFGSLFEDLNAYYNTRWHVLCAKLKRDYFNTPWAIVSFMAAFLLLLLAFIQTMYSILSYKKG